MPETIHAAFDKAAQYFGIRLVKVAVDPITFRADVEAMKRAVNSNTIAVLCQDMWIMQLLYPLIVVKYGVQC